MPRGVPRQIWKDQRVTRIFRRFCQKSIKPSVDWKKFRTIDEKGIFENIPDNILSAQFRKMRLIEEGLCWQCGVNKASEDNGMCTKCLTSIKKMQKKYYKSKKKGS